MSSFCCPICEKPFDSETHVPRMVDCGHTLCSPCLNDLIAGAADGRLVCPEDQELLENYNPDKGVASFPINKVLLKRKPIKKEPEEVREPKDTGTRISNLHSLNMCPKHNKPREIVCHTEAIVICPDCACTAEHKNHDLLNNENFVSFLETSVAALRHEMAGHASLPFFEDHEARIKQLQQAIAHKKYEITAKIGKIFDDWQTILFQKQKDLLFELENLTLEAFGSVTRLGEEVAVWNGRKTDLLAKMATVDNFVKQVDFDYQTVLDSCCKKPDLQDTLNDLVKLCRQFEAKATKSILEKELAISLTVEPETLISFLDRNIRIEKATPPTEDQLAPQADPANPDAVPTKSVDPTAAETDNGKLSKHMTPNKSASFINKNGTRPTPKPEYQPVSGQELIAKTGKFSLLNSRKGSRPTHDAFAAKTEKDAGLLDVSGDDLNMSISAMGSDSQGKKMNDSKSLLDDIDYSDLSALDISHSDKKKPKQKSLLNKKKVMNNSFIKTRDGSPQNPKEPKEKPEPPAAEGEPKREERASAVSNSGQSMSKKMLSSKSNKDILVQPPELRPKKITVDQKGASTLNALANKQEGLGPQPRGFVPLSSLTKPPVDDYEGRETNLLMPLLDEEETKKTPLVKSFLERESVTDSKADPGLTRPFAQSLNEKGSLKGTKRPEGGSMALLNIPQPPKLKVPAKLGQIEEATTEINLVNKRINDSTLTAFLPEIQKNKKAKVLNLSGNFITEVGVGLIVKSLASHVSLEKVVLRDNYVGENVFTVLRTWAPSLRKLRHFDILENHERVDRNKLKNELAALRKVNVFVEMSSK